MSLLVAFDDIGVNGNKFLFEYLSQEFPTKILTNVEDVKNPGNKCLFTTSIKIAQNASSLIPTILYINDPFEFYSARGNDISLWRQNLTLFKSLDSVFVVSNTLATLFFNTYRIPCKVQYPYLPKNNKSQANIVVYNKVPEHIDKMIDFASSESYMEFTGLEDLSFAKLYIHVPEHGEQWHINVLASHSYGVPCITCQQGYFSEFCTNGDKILSRGADAKTWMNTFKTALRDCAINSGIVHNMSQRFNSMNEVQQRIKKVLMEKGFLRTPPTPPARVSSKTESQVAKLQNREKPVESSTFKQKIVRSLIKSDDYLCLVGFINNNSSVYAGVGGLGDALLILAAAHADPGSKIVFGANAGVQAVVTKLFDTVGVEALVVRNFNNSSEGRTAWHSLIDNPHCKGSVHIPRDLNYGDWGGNTKKYIDNMVKRLPFVKLFGKLLNLRDTEKVIGICPRGSDHSSQWKQRFLTKEELYDLVKKLLSEDATVIIFGSDSDLDYYGIYEDNNVIFMNSDFAISHPAPKHSISFRHMLTAINGCDLIISVDTWLKTYAALADLPCKVIMNRYLGKSTLDYTDPSDKIFLNTDIWGFDIITLESLL